jgi:hypothetical protein
VGAGRPTAKNNQKLLLRSNAALVFWLPEVTTMQISRRLFFGSILGAALLASGITIAQAPERDISPARHPNLAAAQRLIDQAFNKITAAQAANEFDMDGHAAKAKDLLDQASRELRAAASAANRNHK